MLRAVSITIAICLFAQFAICADPADTASPRPLRTPSEVLADWQFFSEQLRGILPSPRALTDAERRAEVAPAAVPLLHKAIALNAEIYHTVPAAQSETRRKHYQFLAILALLKDEPSIAELKDGQASNVREIASLSRHAWYSAIWWEYAGNEETAAGILADLNRLAKESPADESLAALLLSLREDGLASSAQDARIRQILSSMTAPLARAAVDQFRAADKRASLLGKPLLLSSHTPDGRPFSTKSLSGRFILVHFGATSSAEWQEQHNRMLQTPWPANLSIVTVLCDAEAGSVSTYLERHRAIPWTVLRPKGDAAGFAAQFGIEEFPSAILIDSSGNVIATDIDAASEAAVADLIAPSSTDTTK